MDLNKELLFKKIEAYYNNFSDEELKNKLINAGFEILDNQPEAFLISENEQIQEFHYPKPITNYTEHSYTVIIRNKNIWKSSDKSLRNVG